APAEAVRLASPAIARDGGPAASGSPESAARGFLRELIARERLAFPDRAHAGTRLHTHEVVEDGEALRVVRRLFD
ncbi:MAG: hypothetical protein ACRD12_19360, partial [Acidimicrobiales bacterium]